MSTERPTHLGEAMTIVGHPFAKPVTNDELFNLAVAQGLPEDQYEKAKEAIAATGFTTRYFSHFPDHEPDMEQGVERSIAIGASLLKEVLDAHEWNGFDQLIVASAILPPSVNQRILEQAGFNPDHIPSRSYRYACAGAVGALVDTVTDPDMKNERVVILALEPLSLLIDRGKYRSAEKISFPSIFGDAYIAAAIEPKRFRLDVRDTLIIPDGGVIKVEPLYEFDEMPNNPTLIPSHYRFAEGGEDIFRYSHVGAFLKLVPTETEELITMDGKATGLFFGDNSTEVLVSLLEQFGRPQLLQDLDGNNLILHPASKPVVNRIGRLLARRGLVSNHVLPFLMDEAQQSNGSSATTFNRWRYMIDHNLIDPQQPMVFLAPGIGSAIVGAIGFVKP